MILIQVPPSHQSYVLGSVADFDAFCKKTGLDQIQGRDYVLYFADWYSASAAKRICDSFGMPIEIISDVEASISPQSEIKPRFIPALGSGVFNILEFYRGHEFSASVQTDHCCNFSVNKPSLDRQLFLKVLEWFQISSCRYTWSGYKKNFDAAPVLESVNKLQDKDIDDIDRFRSHLLSPIGNWFEPAWYHRDTGCLVPYDLDQQPDLGEVWRIYRAEQVSNTAVSLLTESCSQQEPNFVFTEKTLFSILGLTFPIWVGNYGQAAQFAAMGFDTFPDVVNHDYQFYPDLFDRIYWAIKLNLPLLTDLDRVRNLRERCLPRLINNREHVFSDEYLAWLISCYQALDQDLIQMLIVPREDWTLQHPALTAKLQHRLSAL